jgi:hypothetical protein
MIFINREITYLFTLMPTLGRQRKKLNLPTLHPDWEKNQTFPRRTRLPTPRSFVVPPSAHPTPLCRRRHPPRHDQLWCGTATIPRDQGWTKNSLSWLGGSAQKCSDWTHLSFKIKMT